MFKKLFGKIMNINPATEKGVELLRNKGWTDTEQEAKDLAKFSDDSFWDVEDDDKEGEDE